MSWPSPTPRVRSLPSSAAAYAAMGRYHEAADKLIAIPEGQNRTTRRSIEDAAQILRALSAGAVPETVPELEPEMRFVYPFAGFAERTLELAARDLAAGLAVNTTEIWAPAYIAVRKAEFFKKYMRDAGLVDYWRARG